MNKVIVVATLATALGAGAALSVDWAAETVRVRAAKTQLEGLLPDADGVRYRNIVVRPYGVICGEYNAKGRAGGYEGFNQFVARQGKDISRIKAGTEAQMVGHWGPWCEGEPDEIVSAALAEFNHDSALYRLGCLMGLGLKSPNETCVAGQELVRQFRQDFPGVRVPDFKVDKEQTK